ncbi:NAD(P)/FAD-dependent oxidoreductase [Gilvimarinus sp. 1_MG-2023]|uniref:NAD(P)/FAD-dependent oxidoreductase n=1 Tax=Gilvimarinus sp. 1_MG-2023 TaxID=3062638 RepID=UPI0026E38CB7|nr:FAD-dependent oxidoreductase [Gilvimarinus sp. 1_MG-2023]MDO6745868.1 FAD-dependent oxidoreductase [Gilvimarinus sp. 1_MG-2023]
MSDAKQHIAVIGSGISGLYSAFLLSQKYHVSVFEKNSEIGGHTATKKVSVDSGDYSIDTGFIVYNDRTYPNFIRLLNQLGVEGQNTEMGFSVSCQHTGYEYAGTSIAGLFAQRKNIFKRAHWRLLRDIVRFNNLCSSLYQRLPLSDRRTLGEFLRQESFSKELVAYYILPMVSAIWSSGTAIAEQMPLAFFVRFFHNHGLLSIFDQPQWKTVRGGSNQYLAPLIAPFVNQITTDARIRAVQRAEAGVDIHFDDNSVKSFDAVVMACHSDEALGLLHSPSAAEKTVLGAITYKPNQVVLHTDNTILPTQKAAWASWNYKLESDTDTQTLLTYNMNILQNIRAPETFCVSVNPGDRLDTRKVLGEYQYHHPVFTRESIAAQQQWQQVSGADRIYYCGAYWRNGFHEDGVVSALKVAQQLGVTP